jgi:autotransporter-associated beta strand protein
MRPLISICCLGLVILSSHAATYHLDSASGNDTADGLTPATAWRSLAKANSVVYQPGDSLLLKSGGGTWTLVRSNSHAGTLTVSTGPATDFAGWAAFHAVTGSQTGDDDQDGLNNLTEYAFSLNPKTGGSSGPYLTLPNPGTDDESVQVTLSPVPPDTSRLFVRIQAN